MRLGPGRPSKLAEIYAIGELHAEEIQSMVSGSESPIKRLREVHHRIARLKALGLRNSEISRTVGYSEVRISTLTRSPAMRELISQYEGRVDAAYENEVLQHYMSDVVRARMSAARQLADLTEASEEGDVDPLPARTLLNIHDSMADRSGYGKHSTVVNVNLDFAAKLDKAVKRSSTVQKEPQVSSEPRMIDVTPKTLEFDL